MTLIDRKHFISRSLRTAAGFVFLPLFDFAQSKQQEKVPPLDPLEVREFVGAAHKDFPKVKMMLEKNPDLLNSVHNLGGWDWEDAVSASGHVGHVEMTNYLLEKGARMTICVAAMLGKVEIVRTMIETFPYMRNAVGPHKISLMRHARAGEEGAIAVADYLRSIGIKE